MDKPRLIDINKFEYATLEAMNKHYKLNYKRFYLFTTLTAEAWGYTETNEDYESHKQWYYNKYSKLGRALE